MTTKTKNRAPQARTEQSQSQTPGQATPRHPIAKAQDQIGNAELQRRLGEKKGQSTEPGAAPGGEQSSAAPSKVAERDRSIALGKLSAKRAQAEEIFAQLERYGSKLGLTQGELQGILSQRQSFARYEQILQRQAPSESLNSGLLLQAEWTLDGVNSQYTVLLKSVAAEASTRAEKLRRVHYRWLDERCSVHGVESLKEDVHSGMMEAGGVFRATRGRLSPDLGRPSLPVLLRCMIQVEQVARTYDRLSRRYSDQRKDAAETADFYIEVADWVDWSAKLYLGKFAYVMCGGGASGQACESATNVGTAGLSAAVEGIVNDRDIDEILLQTALASAVAAIYEMLGGKVGGSLMKALKLNNLFDRALKTVGMKIAEVVLKKSIEKVGDLPLDAALTFLKTWSAAKDRGERDGVALQLALGVTKKALIDSLSKKALLRDAASVGAGTASGQ